MRARITGRGSTKGVGVRVAAAVLAAWAVLGAGCGGDACEEVVCPEGLVCEGGACVPDGTPGTCATDADCAGLVNRAHCLAEEGRCVQCLETAHCPDPSTQVCAADGWICRVRPPCEASADCADLPATPWCEAGTGTCVACLEDGHCAGVQRTCTEGWCRFDPCDSDADCEAVPGAPWCSTLTGECRACLSDAHCAGEDRCVDGRCLPPGECEVESDCPVGQACDTRRAVPACVPCASSLDCRLGGQCWSNACIAAFTCEADPDCLPGQRCDDSGACVACLTSADCAAGQACAEGVCRAPSPCGPGALCPEREACSSGVCAPAPCTPDAYEPDDTPYAAHPLPEGPVEAGLCPNEWDWYVLREDPADGLVVRVAFTAPAGERPTLRLWAGDGSRPVALAEPVVTADGLEARVNTLSWRPPYWIGLRGVNAPLDYRLDVEGVPGGLCPDDAREPDDTADVAHRAELDGDTPVTLEGRACPGDADWVRVTVPGGRRLTATLEADPSVGVTAFVAGEDGGPAPVTGEGDLAEAPLVDGDTVHWLRVRTDPAGSGADYRLTLRLRPPRPPGDLCEVPPVLQPGDTVQATTVGAGDHGASACGGAGAPDVAFAFSLDAASRVTAATDGDLDAVLSLQAACGDAATETACSDRPGSAEAVSAVLPAGAWILWVDGYGAREGDFTARLEATPAGPPPPENGCAAPPALDVAAGGGVATAELADARDLLSAGCGLPGADAAWRLELAEDASLTARLEAPAGASLSVRGLCDDSGTEEVCAAVDGEAAEVFLPRLPAGSWFLVADGVPVDDAAVRLTWALGSPVPVPPHDGCAAPSVLDPAGGPVRVTGDTRAAGDDRTPACAAGPGRDVVYAIQLAAPAAISARLEAAWEGVLALEGACGGGAGSERVCSDAAPPTLFEPALPAGTWHLWVDAWDGGAGPFALTVEASAPRPVPSHDACEAALPLGVDGGPVMGSTWRASDDLDPGPACTGSPAPGPDVFHRLDLAAGQRVEVLASPDEGYDLALYLVDGCGAPVCLAGADASFVSGPERVAWTAPAAGPVWVVVDAWAAGEAGDYTIEARSLP